MKNLTVKYSAQQFMYWAAVGGVVSFAASYLLSHAFTAAQIGLILFGAFLLSFLFQPLLGSFADRCRRNILPAVLLILSGVSVLCFLSVRFFALPRSVFSALYLLGIVALDMQIPMMNSLSVYYTSRGWKINYGLGRGVGGFGFALATLGYGYLMEYLGEDWMPIAAVAFILASAAIGISYPRNAGELTESKRCDTAAPSTIVQFIVKYKWYCASLFGVLFLGTFHAMTENYLIEIFNRIGGNSSNVGTALFIATVTELPGMTVYPLVLKKFGSKKLLLVSAVCFTLKGILLILSSSVTAVYFVQVLQCFTYVLLSMSQLYYAEECTAGADMIKGQTMITAFYTLGCAVGNLLGGVLISANGVVFMMYMGIVIAAVGLVLFAVTLPRAAKEKEKLQA